jgi:phosphoribosylanthranilate isomerase
MHRTRVKICGVTRLDDALAAAEAGADAIGMVLKPGLVRSVSLIEAGRIARALPPFVSAVGLFVDADLLTMRNAVAEAELNALQLHGHETRETVEGLTPIPVIKAVHVDAGTFELELTRLRRYADAGIRLSYLFDTAGGGGRGAANDWDLLRRCASAGRFTGPLSQWIAAGGLTPKNVGEVVRQLRPWGVDVSTGVESSKREKSPELIWDFIRAVREADADNDGSTPSPPHSVTPSPS